MTEDTTGDDIVNFLQQLRIELLHRLKNNTIVPKDYASIIRYMGFPTAQLVSKDKILATTTNQQLKDLSQFDLDTLRKITLSKLCEFYKNQRDEFSEICQKGQYVIWHSVFTRAENLIELKRTVKSLNYGIRSDNYIESCSIVREFLTYLAEGFKEIVLFEKKIGVDRYLATSGLKEDIEILHEIVREIRDICNEKLEEFINIFQSQWNLTSVSRCIKRMLDSDVEENEITSCMFTNQKRVIFLLLDGVGYAQYLWLLSGLRERKSITFSINLFEWLKSSDAYNDKLILGSTLVTDTGSALATIFSGKIPSDTGVVASNMFSNGEILDIKRCYGNKLLNLVAEYPNTFLADLNEVDILVLDGSGKIRNSAKYSFSKMIYGNCKIIPVNPPDRIFKSISTKISSENRKQLIVAYFPLIDRTGHSIGAFTSFESFEYEKLNVLMVEFLLDLAYNKKEIFDGETTIVISADHGMFETSSKFITIDEIKRRFGLKGMRIPFIVINNRSLLFYGIEEGLLEYSRQAIVELLKEKGILCKIYTKSDPFVEEMLCGEEKTNNCPDLIALFSSDGVGLTQTIEEVLLHHGGHGGCSCEEVFVPFITIRLTHSLYINLINQFHKLK